MATGYGLLVLGISGATALRGRPALALQASGYIAAAEVLWRMSGAQLPWEGGKYGVLLVLGMALLRRSNRGPSRIAALPAVFFLLLLPSSILTLGHPSVPEPIETLRFNLSGPATIALTAVFTCRFQMRPIDLDRALVAGLGPLLSVASVTVVSTYLSGPIQFTTQSLSATSGGFGANQVSTMLGLGAVFSLVLLLTKRQSTRSKLLLLGLLFVFIVQSGMTFSRGGLYGVVGAALVGMFYWVRDRRVRWRLIALAGVAILTLQVALLPRLNDFTSGALGERFSSTDTTGRFDLFLADIRLFRDNLIFGVGPGVAAYEREGVKVAAAHTEFTRLVSEHGLLGLVALLLLLSLAFRSVSSAPGPTQKGTVAALLAWGFLSMLHSGMRLAAHGFVLGFAIAFAAPADSTDKGPAP